MIVVVMLDQFTKQVRQVHRIRARQSHNASRKTPVLPVAPAHELDGPGSQLDRLIRKRVPNKQTGQNGVRLDRQERDDRL